LSFTLAKEVMVTRSLSVCLSVAMSVCWKLKTTDPVIFRSLSRNY